MSSITNLHQLFQNNERDRIAKEQKAIDRIIDPALPRHTIYKGDRTIQQLGDQPIENGIVLNNQSLAIGDVVLPLAKGNVLRRIDSTNGGALLGTAYRDAVEKDVDPNGKRRKTVLSRNGASRPIDDPINDPNSFTILGKFPDRVPPPFGCLPPPVECIWSKNPIAPDGFQNHGDAVVNENALPVYLHCVAGTSVPANLNCGFLDLPKWSCLNGVCLLTPNGIYTSQAQCESARIIVPQLFVRATWVQSCNPSFQPVVFTRDCVCENLQYGDTFNFQLLFVSSCAGDYVYRVTNARNGSLVTRKDGGDVGAWYFHEPRRGETIFEILPEPNQIIVYGCPI